ncbi:MAG: hypothetical protein SGI74_04750 [Oligoflexia bacterium]|nr:hypothetical protein [Oligoflexia bacterium]
MKTFLFCLLIFIPLTFSYGQEDHSKHNVAQPIKTSQQQQIKTSHQHQSSRPFECSDAEYVDPALAMCVPRPGEYIGSLHTMVHGNAFLIGQSSSGKRGKRSFAAPHMLMIESGSSLDMNNYVNLELMLTSELWTLPNTGNPELLQIGEENSYRQPYIDAQHPHTSPIMGLTLSDTIRLPVGNNHAKIFYSPRGSSTAGPIAFMHRPTGMVNPDAPLGHHLGQDSGHISSNVLGGALQLGALRIEPSVFHGLEPHPTETDIELGRFNSYALRLTQELSPSIWLMGSAAYITSPEHDDTGLAFRVQYSLSAYTFSEFSHHFKLINALIVGMTRNNSETALRSIGEEFIVPLTQSKIWGRFELIERRPAELLVVSANSGVAQWLTALTLGYTYDLFQMDSLNFGLGGSVTHNILPPEFANAYDGNPWTGKVFVQLSGADSFDF